MSRNLVPLVDLDIIVYRAGFAVPEDEPLENHLQVVRTTLEGILSEFPDAPYWKGYLTGTGNYRERVAVTKPYKGNRDKSHKPKYYDEIRDYLRDYHGAIMVDDMEADDALGMEQWKNKDKSTVICSIDKDLRCIPGWHYNFVKRVLDYVDIGQANRNFWKQVVQGDPTDNIVGLPKYGPKAAEHIISSTDGSWVDMHTRVKREYEAIYQDEADSKFEEMATLVWILREPYKNFNGEDIFGEEESSEEEGSNEDPSV